jgi:D-sedoheptulose 7-phosphate isomerase
MKNNSDDYIVKYINNSLSVISKIPQLQPQIATASNMLLKTLENGGSIYWLGNGGSASDAEHLSAELAGRFAIDRKPLPSFSLTSNSSIITAISNDYGYENVFSRQIQAYVKKNDAVVGITTSGTSLNVVNALKMANSIGAQTLVLTGKNLEQISFVDLIISIDSGTTAHIQEAHIIVGQCICGVIEATLFQNES